MNKNNGREKEKEIKKILKSRMIVELVKKFPKICFKIIANFHRDPLQNFKVRGRKGEEWEKKRWGREGKERREERGRKIHKQNYYEKSSNILCCSIEVAPTSVRGKLDTRMKISSCFSLILSLPLSHSHPSTKYECFLKKKSLKWENAKGWERVLKCSGKKIHSSFISLSLSLSPSLFNSLIE